MRRAKRYRLALGVTLLAALVSAFGVYWWAGAKGLSPAERQLVGTWQHPHGPTPGAPSGFSKVWHLAADRSCRVEVLDAASGQTLDILAGRWSARDRTLMCDWEANPLARAGRAIPASWTGTTDTKLDPYLIELVSDGEVVLRPRGNPATYHLRRVVER